MTSNEQQYYDDDHGFGDQVDWTNSAYVDFYDLILANATSNFTSGGGHHVAHQLMPLDVVYMALFTIFLGVSIGMTIWVVTHANQIVFGPRSDPDDDDPGAMKV